MTDSGSPKHGLRVMVGLVWMMALVIAQGMAYKGGFGLIESIAIGIIGPPIAIVAMYGGAWVLGTLLVWLNHKLGIVELVE